MLASDAFQRIGYLKQQLSIKEKELAATHYGQSKYHILVGELEYITSEIIRLEKLLKY